MDLNVSIVQIPLAWEDKEYNLSYLSRKISLIKEGTDIVVLPEMFSTGFSMNSEAMGETMNGETVRWMKNVAKENKVFIVGSLIIKEKSKYFNRLLVVGPKGVESSYDKRHLFTMAEEDKNYSAGQEKVIWNHKGWRICLQICYDLRFPVFSRNQSDYDCLIYIANWPEKRSFPWKTLLLARAMENQAYVIGCNRIGNDANGIYYSGDSAIIDPIGEYLIKCTPHEEGVYYQTLSKVFLERCRKQFPVLSDRDKFELID